MLSAGVVGGTGYTGVELLRLLALHGEAEVVAITSRAERGRRLDDLYPNLRGHYDLAFSEPDVATLAACDIVFFATPHNVAMNLVPELLAAGARIIDLSADYRLRDAELWSQWYGEPPASPELLDEAVYGLPETFVIDRTGRIRYKHIGPIMPHDLDKTIRPILESLGS